MPFSPRVLVHLIGLDRRVVQGLVGGGSQCRRLEPVPQPEQVGAVPPQFAGQPRRGDALGDAAEDQDDLGGAAVGLVEGGPGEGVEDPPAGRAAVVEDRGAVAAMDLQAVAIAAARAGQAVGVERHQEVAIAGVLVH
jgi:hypothetical protein